MKNKTILTIDDDEAIRTSFRMYLSDCGYNPLTAESGAAGLKCFETEQPDLVLIDLRMPEIDGFEVIARIKELSPETPLVVVSGMGELDDAIRAIRLGAWDYLTKPVEDLPTLLHTIEKALERAQLIKENREYREQLEEKVKSRTQELKQANKNLTRINTRLRKIVETTRNLSACDTVHLFSRQLLDEFSHHMQVAGGSFYLADEKGLELTHALNPGHNPQQIPFPLKQNSIFDKVFKNKTALLIEDITKEADMVASGWEKYRYKSALVFPLVDESRFVIGVLSLHDKTPPPFSSQDKEIGSILASFCCETLRAIRASEEVSKSERRLGLAIQGGDLGTWDWKVATGKVFVNKQWLEITGCQNNKFDQNKSSWEEMIHPNDLAMVNKLMDNHFTGRTETYESEHRIKQKTGELIWVLDKGKVIERDKTGKPLRVCGTYLNITPRKKAQGK